ncbi:MAG TPA: DUF2804 domain-containing protein [Anaerolineaceae bacterium]|nr:DUF2804 domain-containing protein [Anaerolineaceae bacterium]HPN51697.1 DUF2804 domain-containing protein [Anaerolineaceae bacterium]
MTKYPQTYSEPELSLSTPVKMCLSDGTFNPAARGWSRQPVHVSNLTGAWPRKKVWNYWCVVSPEMLFSVTLSNIDYMGLAFAYFLDFKTKEFIEQTVMMPFGKGCHLPETVSGKILFEHKDMKILMDDQGEQIAISVESTHFGGRNMKVSLDIHRPANLESMNVTLPWNQRQYHFTSKQNCLPVSGVVDIDGRKYSLSSERDYACLDFGRGIWKYKSFWNWSSFSTHVGSDQIGVNLGAGWTDGSGATENSVLINGHLEKLSEDVLFDYDPLNFMKPWHLHSGCSNQVDLVFTPFYERVAKTDLVILRSEVHQMIGKFQGKVISRNGSQYEISDAIGWAEEHNALW